MKLEKLLKPFPLKLIQTSFFGRGLQTTTSLKFGDVIFHEQPLVTFPELDPFTSPTESAKKVAEGLDDETKSIIEELAPLNFPWEEPVDDLTGRLIGNALQDYVFGIGSLLNHSCFPNICIDTNFDWVATRDIDEGEELFICYTTPYADEMRPDVICTQDEDCVCLGGSPEYPINKKKNVAGYIYTFLSPNSEEDAHDVRLEIEFYKTPAAKNMYKNIERFVEEHQLENTSQFETLVQMEEKNKEILKIWAGEYQSDFFTWCTEIKGLELEEIQDGEESNKKYEN